MWNENIMPISDDDRAILSAYLDGELDEATAERLEARLSLEPEVRAAYEAMRRTWGLLDYLPKVAPSPALTNRTLERVTLERRAAPTTRLAHAARRFPAAAVGWAVAVLVAAGIGYVAGGRLPTAAPEVPPPPDPDEALVRHLRVIERWPFYQHADDLGFLRRLDDPDLFGDDPGS